MKEIFDILGETMLLATFQPRRDRNAGSGFGEYQTEAPSRHRPERKADRKRVW